MSSDPRTTPSQAPAGPSRFDGRPAAAPCAQPGVAPFCRRVEAMVVAERFEHILRVAALAEAIAVGNAFSSSEVEATVLAAVLHDVARDLQPERMFELAPPQTALEREHPLTLHGRAGRTLAERWGVRDERVLGAIAGHVVGVPIENRVGMAVYVADVSEPGRGVNADIRELAMSNLLRAYRRAVDSKVRYLRAKGKAVHPRTLEVYEQVRHLT